LKARQPSMINAVAIGIALTCGFIAAAQIGKVPVALPLLQRQLDLSLVQAGWVAASINAASALLGLVAGLAASRAGAHRSLLLGLALIGLGSLLGAVSPNGELLLVSRLLEGVGFVLIVVSAPSIIAAATPMQSRRTWLAAWGCYMPTGVAFMLLLAPLLILLGGWRAIWWFSSLLIGLALITAWSLRRHLLLQAAVAPAPLLSQVSHSSRLTAHWIMGAAFAAYSAQWFMIATWLPSFAVEHMGLTLIQAAWLTAAVTFVNITGNLGAPHLARAGIARWKVIAAVEILLGGLGFIVFSSELPAEGRMLAAVVASAAGGALPGTVMAAVPVHARSPLEVALGNGIVVQCINVGVLLGPPAIAAVVAGFGGWDAGRWLFPLIGAGGAVIAFAFGRLEVRQLTPLEASHPQEPAP
jgi:CP family cyanate transporter-like MFS transporter